MTFCPRQEQNSCTAGIGFVPQKRADLDEVYLCGAPDLVIEVLRAVDSASAMYAHEELCLSTGCAGFWVVDPDRQTVRVTRPGSFVVYHSGEQIPLPLAGGGTLAVDAIFPPPAQ